jgi:hypothetical protein
MRLLYLIGTAVLALTVTAAAPAKKAPPKKAAPAAAPAAPKNACATCTERAAILDPGRFSDTRIYEREVKPAYEAARQYPATLDRLHCFCECKESMTHRHRTLLTCFTNDHAAGCGICIREALLAKELKDKGLSDDEVENTVESIFKTDGHPPTHGPG